MNNRKNDLNPFEEEIRQTYDLPDADPAFFNHLEASLQHQQSKPKVKANPVFHLGRGWAYATITLVLIVIMVLAIGPSKVLAQIQTAFGFVPGIGLVNTSSPFKQLAEPVSGTKDGITLNIQSAFLSDDQTMITYTISDLPIEMKGSMFGEPKCSIPAFLNLPNGEKIEATGSSGGISPDGSFVHVMRLKGQFPLDLDHATLVFPCLEGAVQGKGPVDWQFALAFTPAPEDIAIYPATLVSPQVKIENIGMNPESETGNLIMPAMVVDGDRQEDMVVLAIIEKPEVYWVTWAYPFNHDEDIQINGHLYISPFNPVLYDANGTPLPAPNYETQIELWQYEDSLRNQLSDEDQIKYGGSLHTFAIPKSGIAFPVYVKQNVYERSFPEKAAYADVEFDGTEVQNSDEPVEINQEIQLGSVKFELKAIEKSQYGGYSFLFNGTEGRVVQCLVEVVGYPADMSGSGNFTIGDLYHFSQSKIYTQIPTGMLTLRVSQPAVLSDLVSFIGSWSPQ
jgi:hypothetical protein